MVYLPHLNPTLPLPFTSPSRWTYEVDCALYCTLYSGSVWQRLRDDGNLHPLTLSYSSKINGYLYPQRVSPRLKNNYLCTYNLYGPCVMLLMRAASVTWASGRGLGPEIESFVGPVKWHRPIGECHLGPKKLAIE